MRREEVAARAGFGMSLIAMLAAIGCDGEQGSEQDGPGTSSGGTTATAGSSNGGTLGG
jgi:hypothetical protein